MANLTSVSTVRVIFTLIVFNIVTIRTQNDQAKYEPTWESLDSRPLPLWFDEAKLGIFIHWGIFSVPGYGSEWFWAQWKYNQPKYVDFMDKNYPPGFTYQEFAKDFKAELFDADKWARLFAKSGAKYVVLTSKHHEGYTLWPSRYSYSWNSMDVGPHRDLVGELANAVRTHNMTFGLYNSLLEWYHPVYEADKTNRFLTQEFVDNKILPEVRELVNNYKPEILWSDGHWEASSNYWKARDFLAWLYNESPVKDTVVVNDRWGSDTPCKHGGYYTCQDRYNPGSLQTHKWENAMTIDMVSWGYRREAGVSEYFSIKDIIVQLVSTASYGGNLLLNIGPTKDGTIIPIFEERLTQMGEWLDINGEAIYATSPWIHQQDSFAFDIWYTVKSKVVYAIIVNWPAAGVRLASALDIFRDPSTTITLLGNEGNGHLHWTVNESYITVALPNKSIVKSEWAWVLKIESQANLE